jgi:hypothetical protein
MSADIGKLPIVACEARNRMRRSAGRLMVARGAPCCQLPSQHARAGHAGGLTEAASEQQSHDRFARAKCKHVKYSVCRHNLNMSDIATLHQCRRRASDSAMVSSSQFVGAVAGTSTQMGTLSDMPPEDLLAPTRDRPSLKRGARVDHSTNARRPFDECSTKALPTDAARRSSSASLAHTRYAIVSGRAPRRGHRSPEGDGSPLVRLSRPVVRRDAA